MTSVLLIDKVRVVDHGKPSLVAALVQQHAAQFRFRRIESSRKDQSGIPEVNDGHRPALIHPPAVSQLCWEAGLTSMRDFDNHGPCHGMHCKALSDTSRN